MRGAWVAAIGLFTFTGCLSYRDQVQGTRRKTERVEQERDTAVRRAGLVAQRSASDGEYVQRRRAELLAALNDAEVGRRTQVLAVFDVEDLSAKMPEAEREKVATFIALSLAEHSRHRVLPRSALRARLVDEKASTYAACYDERCQVELGMALAADLAVAPKLLALGPRCVLGLSIQDLSSETVVWASSVETGCGVHDLFEAARALSQRFGSSTEAREPVVEAIQAEPEVDPFDLEELGSEEVW